MLQNITFLKTIRMIKGNWPLFIPERLYHLLYIIYVCMYTSYIYLIDQRLLINLVQRKDTK